MRLNSNGVASALLIDETRRVLGDHWVQILHQTTRRPDLDTPDNPRDEVRDFLAEEIRHFPEWGYPNHPNYDGHIGTLPSPGGQEIQEITTEEFVERRTKAQLHRQHGDTIALWSGDTTPTNGELDGHDNTDELDGNAPVIEVYKIGHKPLRLARLSVDARPGPELAECLVRIAEHPEQATAIADGQTEPGPRPERLVIDVDSRAEIDLDSSHLYALNRVFHDEIRRVAGTHVLQRGTKAREEDMSGMGVAYMYANEHPHVEDEFWPPTEANLRAFARADVAGDVQAFEQNLGIHPDYDGLYDPHGQTKSDGERLLDAIDEADIVVGNEWGIGTAKRKSGSASNSVTPDGDYYSVTTYAPSGRDVIPTMAGHTSLDTTNPKEVRDGMLAMIRAREKEME